MARRTLQKIMPFHPPEAFKPPEGAVAAGVTPDGRQLYRTVEKRSRAVPLYVNTPEAKAREKELKEEGKSTEEIGKIMTQEGYRQYRKNQMTGELAYPLNKPETYTYERLFYIESQGNGNNALIDYRPPTPEELEAVRRQERVKALGGGRLAEIMVDEGLTPEDLVAAVRRPKKADAVTVVDESDESEESDVEDAPQPKRQKRGRR